MYENPVSYILIPIIPLSGKSSLNPSNPACTGEECSHVEGMLTRGIPHPWKECSHVKAMHARGRNATNCVEDLLVCVEYPRMFKIVWKLSSDAENVHKVGDGC